MEIWEGVIRLGLRPTLLNLHNIILHKIYTQPHSLIVNYYYYQRWHRLGL